MSRINAQDVHKIIGSHMLADGLDLVVDLEKSRGSHLHDARSGRDFLDMTSFFASSPLGLNPPSMEDDEFRASLMAAALNKVTNSDFYTREMAECVQVFAEVGIPDYLPHLFFIEGGALAVENTLKTAFDWKVRKNMAAGRKTQINQLSVIHFRGAFHGRSGYTLSMTNTSDPRKYMYFPLFDWPRVDPACLSFPVTQEVLDRVQLAEQECENQIRAAVADAPNHVAGLIVEGVMGEGGDRHFRPEFFQRLRRLCDELELFFIVDEVQSGVGLTGRFWAHEHYDVKPDAISFGKKSQVCGMLAGPRVDEVEHNVFSESSRINSTWGGNLVDMVRFRRILETIRDEKLLENAQQMGARLLAGLEALQTRHAGLSNARGKGLMCAFDLPIARRQPMLDACYEHGVILLPCGDESIRLRPQLAVLPEEIDQTLAVLEKAAQSAFA
jgi:L-lysine 6-transaminase